ncbi:FecR domain-containing protein [Chitinophaga sp. 212800010-3]|uniref:FecR family protein n=1 Tax=unclassified Chitinophaga TaxID=2619133 RepID=UPI002DE5674A|nr:DUF4974 domain-containing protein [Chitinophaga sp. 212800010-3]
MSTSEFRKIVERYLEGTASVVDQAMIEAWLAATEDNPVDLAGEELQQVRAEMLQHLRAHNGHEWSPEAYADRQPEPSMDIIVQEDEKNLKPSVRRLTVWFQRVAAVLIIVLAGVSGVYYWRLTNKKNAPVALATQAPVNQYRVRVPVTRAIRKIMLPDSTLVILNRASSLHYNMPFDTNSREVFLDGGEAFFEVTRNSGNPFKVHAGKTTTTVLGTAFNVRLYDSAASVSIAVKSGKVKVSAGIQAADSSVILQREQGVAINTAENSVHTFSQSARVTTAWWDEVLVFHQQSMEDVVAILENHFRVKIYMKTPSPQRYQVSGDFSGSRKLTDILDAICLVHRLSYKKKNNEYFIY